MLVRDADPERDGAVCAAIYAPYVEGSGVSFEDVAPTAEQFTALIAESVRRYPWLVLEHDGAVAGYAYASQHHPRSGYRWAADVAVYVDPAWQGRGVGRRLYTALFDLLRRQGLRSAIAGIALPNDASIGLHEAFGFELVGTYRAIGWKAGAWRDVSWWQLQLAPDAAGHGPPPEPLDAPQL
ncbi:MAG TPA: GNAT family N-acetyltransferase [Solirubrobacteraceae bacterium]|nr:GNAT family N-acetyltransferase [Solirubrobacteraceae bacterium]